MNYKNNQYKCYERIFSLNAQNVFVGLIQHSPDSLIPLWIRGGAREEKRESGDGRKKKVKQI